MPIKVGFVGAGGIASAHMNILQAIDDVQIVAVADTDKLRAESVASRFVARAYKSCTDMLESESLDVVYVCVPPYAHEDIELEAAARGIHLFVEKPVSISLDRAREVRDAVISKGIVTAVGYHWRYQSNTDRARSVLAGKTIGMVLGYWMSSMVGVPWWKQMALSGGQMVEQTTHIFDLARYICGEIDEVYAASVNRDSQDIPDYDIYDVGTATLKFANGAIGTISNTTLLNIPYTVGLDVIAKGVVVEIHGDLKIKELGHTETFSGGVNAMLEESKAFIEAVRTGNRSNIRSDYADAVKTLAVTLACNESVKTGKPVKVVV